MPKIQYQSDESWELDALDPDVLTDLVDGAIRKYLDVDLWNEQQDQQEDERRVLTATSKHWPEVSDYVGALEGE